MSTRKSIRNTQKRGIQQVGKVEAINAGKVIVRLSNKGTRLTNLEYLGEQPQIGASVIVDYSSGTPFVRTQIADQLEVIKPAPTFSRRKIFEDTVSDPPPITADMYCSLGRTTPFVLSREVWTPVEWNTIEYDSNAMKDKGDKTKIIIPISGLYYVVVCAAFNKIVINLVPSPSYPILANPPYTGYHNEYYPNQPQGWCGIQIKQNGIIIASNGQDSIHTGKAYNIFSCDTTANAQTGDIITIEVFQDIAEPSILVIKDFLYPSVKIQYFGSLS